MITLKIHHRTTYRNRQPVNLGPHRLMLRPHESRELRLLSSDVTVTPSAAVTWAHDMLGSAVATVVFQTKVDNLVIASLAGLPSIKEHFARFGDKLPKGLADKLAALEQRLG